MQRRSNMIVSFAFLAVIGLPLLMLLIGVRPDTIENRQATPRPELSPEKVLSGEFGEQGDDYLTDLLPGRQFAVRVDADVDLALGDSPSPEVAVGTDGWLFLQESLDQPCLSESDVAALDRQLRKASAVVAATGRQLVVVIAPDKASIHDERLRFAAECVTANAAGYEALGDDRNVLTAWDEMDQAADTEVLFTPIDTHWTNRGATIMGRQIVDALAPGSWNAANHASVGESQQTGDLSRLIGKPEDQTLESYVAIGPGAASLELGPVSYPDGEPVPGLEFRRFSSPQEAPVTGNTLVLHNSFGWALIPTLAPYFEDATFIARTRPEVSYLEQYVRRADSVVLQVAQRGVFSHFVGIGLAEEFVAALSNELDSAIVEISGDVATVVTESSESYLVAELEDPTAIARVTIGDKTYRLDRDVPAIAVHTGGGPVHIEVPDNVSIVGRVVQDPTPQ